MVMAAATEFEVNSPPNTGQSGRVSLPPIRTTSVASGMRRIPMDSAIPRSNRGFSKKLQDMIKNESIGNHEKIQHTRGSRVKYEAKNWKQLSEKQISKLTPIERSRYLAYEAIPKDVVDKRLESLKRIRVIKEKGKEYNQQPTMGDMIEYERNSELVGQLKAAEARHRIRLLRMRHQCNREEELAHLISSQPSSIEAVRLQSFIPPLVGQRDASDVLNRHERIRCETILEDDKGLTINRTQ